MRLRTAGPAVTGVAGYRLLEELGSGGFSTVYAAEDLAGGRRVALKVARDRDRETRERFAAEAAIGERLASSRGVVGTLLRTETTDGRPALVMPYYDLGSAAELLAEERRLPLPAVAELVGQVAQGLDAMHRQHYLHRDVSPRNILRSSELGAAVGDLGCARAINSTVQAPQTEALTPGYSAPEADTGAAVQTISSDVYALAATAWALLSGEPPHGAPPAPTELGLRARYELRRTSQPPPADRLRATGVPDEVTELLVNALAPDPARRPARVLDLSDALTAAAAPAAARTLETGASRVETTGVSSDETAGLVGPVRPPPASLRVTLAAGTERVGGSRASGDDVGRGSAVGAPGRRRGLAVAAVLACFVVGFVVVRMLAGPPEKAPEVQGFTTPRGPASGPSTPSGGRAEAPHDLKIIRDAGTRVTLSWTSPRDRDALSVLYRSTAGGPWKPESLTLRPGQGRAVMPVASSTARYCFRLVVVVRSEAGVNSNRTCTARTSAAPT